MDLPVICCLGNWFEKHKYPASFNKQWAIFIEEKYKIVNGIDNIFIQVEPELLSHNEEYLLANHHLYKYIFTYNENVIKSCPNAIKYIYGTTWISPLRYNNIDLTKKKYQISNFAGTKLCNNAPGHLLRQLIHHNQSALSAYPITFFRSYHQLPHIHNYGCNPFLVSTDCPLTDNAKLALFDEFQFSIIIENNRMQNYFTEKIMDCIISKTIPIYYGCPNIGEFFDTTGWIILETNTLDELVSKLKILGPHHYKQHLDVVEKNVSRALQYTDWYKNLDTAFTSYSNKASS